MTLYVLQHVHHLEDDLENIKFIGVYSSEENAMAAIKRLSLTPGFAEAIDGFDISKYEVDKDHWVDGYVDLTR